MICFSEEKLNPFWPVIVGSIDKHHLQIIYDEIDRSVLDRAGVGGSSASYVPEVRSTWQHWIDPHESVDVESRPIHKLMHQLFQEANHYFAFDTFGVCNEIQYLEYHSKTHDKFEFHTDAMNSMGLPHSQRKISMSIQLSENVDYVGCDLEFPCHSHCDPTRWRRKGTVIAFPSIEPHRVTPITTGARRALIAWSHGPRWR